MPRRPAITPLADLNAADGGVGTVDRALSVLAVFGAATPTPSLSEIASATRISPSSVLRILASFEHAHVVVRQPDGRYALGAEIERLHRTYASTYSLEALVMPRLRELSARSQESAAYFVPQGDQRLCLYRVDSPRAVRAHINAGELLPIRSGAAGRVLMAYGDDPRLAKGPISTRIRREQFAALKGDRVPEVSGISAPVFGSDRRIAGAISLIMPTERFDPVHAPAVCDAARELTALLGGSYPDPH